MRPLGPLRPLGALRPLLMDVVLPGGYFKKNLRRDNAPLEAAVLLMGAVLLMYVVLPGGYFLNIFGGIMLLWRLLSY